MKFGDWISTVGCLDVSNLTTVAMCPRREQCDKSTLARTHIFWRHFLILFKEYNKRRVSPVPKYDLSCVFDFMDKSIRYFKNIYIKLIKIYKNIKKNS